MDELRPSVCTVCPAGKTSAAATTYCQGVRKCQTDACHPQIERFTLPIWHWPNSQTYPQRVAPVKLQVHHPGHTVPNTLRMPHHWKLALQFAFHVLRDSFQPQTKILKAFAKIALLAST